jgi:hypothetical protein
MEEIGHLVEGLEQFVRAYGAAAVLVIIMLEALGMPLPGGSLLTSLQAHSRARERSRRKLTAVQRTGAGHAAPRLWIVVVEAHQVCFGD